MLPLPTCIDFEASSLSHTSYPIEVAWNSDDGGVKGYLVSPAGVADWTEWSDVAERMHGIAREELLAEGHSPAWVCDRVEEELAGRTVYSDAPSFDQMWLSRLFAASGRSVPEIMVSSIDYLLHDILAPKMEGRGSVAMQLAVLKLEARRAVAGKHRAAWDVEYLVELWRRTVAYQGEEPRK